MLIARLYGWFLLYYLDSDTLISAFSVCPHPGFQFQLPRRWLKSFLIDMSPVLLSPTSCTMMMRAKEYMQYVENVPPLDCPAE